MSTPLRLAFALLHCLLASHALTETQRAMVAAKVANLGHGGDRRSDQVANLHIPTQAQAAQALNVSSRSVASARSIIDDGGAELRTALRVRSVPSLLPNPYKMWADPQDPHDPTNRRHLWH